jgi:hypothetical protein
MFPPTSLPRPSQPVLITDSLSSPADFLVFQLGLDHLKSSAGARCVFISAAHDVARWTAVSSKLVRLRLITCSLQFH